MVRCGPAPQCLVSSKSTTDPVPAQSRGQFGGVFDPNPGGSGGIRQPEQLHRGFGESPTWTLPTNIASPLTHQPQGLNLGAMSAPFLNQGFNASISSHAAQRQYGNQPPSNPSLNYPGAPPSFHPLEYGSSDTRIDRLPQVGFSGTSGNNQSTIPRHSVGGVYVSNRLGETLTFRVPQTGRPLQLAAHRTPEYVQPLWQDKSSAHPFTHEISEPINSLNNLLTTGQGQASPARDSQSIPGPIGVIPNMSPLRRTALGASPASIPPGASRPDPVEHFSSYVWDGFCGPPLGNSGQMDDTMGDEDRAQAQTVFQPHRQIPSYFAKGELTGVYSLVPQGREERHNPKATERDTSAQASGPVSPAWQFPLNQGIPMAQAATVRPTSMPDLVPDTVWEEGYAEASLGPHCHCISPMDVYPLASFPYCTRVAASNKFGAQFGAHESSKSHRKQSRFDFDPKIIPVRPICSLNLCSTDGRVVAYGGGRRESRRRTDRRPNSRVGGALCSRGLP